MICGKSGYSSHSTTDEALARRIAAAFSDSQRLRDYIIRCRKYSPEVIRRAFVEAMATQPSRLRKSRAALFFYLVKQHAHRPP